MNDVEIVSPDSLRRFAEGRIVNGETASRVAGQLGMVSIPEWAFGELEAVSAVWAGNWRRYLANRVGEVENLAAEFHRHGTIVARIVASFQAQDAVNAAQIIGSYDYADGPVTPPVDDDRSAPGRPEGSGWWSGMDDFTRPATQNSKDDLVEREVMVEQWVIPTMTYIDSSGELHELPAYGLAPVETLEPVTMPFHNFALATEGGDALEMALREYGPELEEAELIAQSLGANETILGEYIIPAWLSSPTAIVTAVERLKTLAPYFDAEIHQNYDSSKQYVAPQWSGHAKDTWAPYAEATVQYSGTVKDNLYGQLGYALQVADHLRRVRDTCAEVVLRRQAEIIEAKNKMVDELIGAGTDIAGSLLDLNPGKAVLEVFEAVARSANQEIHEAALAELNTMVDLGRIKSLLTELSLAPEGGLEQSIDLAATAPFFPGDAGIGDWQPPVDRGPGHVSAEPTDGGRP